MFAIEELSRSFVARSSGTLITAIIFSGVVALGLQGNYLYFGQIKAISDFHWTLIPVLVAASLLSGVAGGLFGWLMLNVPRWLPGRWSACAVRIRCDSRSCVAWRSR